MTSYSSPSLVATLRVETPTMPLCGAHGVNRSKPS